MSGEEKALDRRSFLKTALRFAGVAAALGIASRPIFALFGGKKGAGTVWQIDPDLCQQCGRCQVNCVLELSAVKCVHAFEVCGYCDLCGGYYSNYAKRLDTSAENQLCPTAALTRKYVEDPYFQYTIDEATCVGCGRCVKGCAAFGNGSLYLQIRHDRCLGCNECSIGRQCPARAIRRVPRDRPYLLKGKGRTKDAGR